MDRERTPDRGSLAVMVCRRCRARFNVPPDYVTSVRCPTCDSALETRSKDPLAQAAPPEDPLGKVYGGCRIEELLGRGAYGSLYRAYHPTLKRDVALKMVPLTSRKRALLKRMVFEARTIARIEHPNIVQVHDVGVQAPYLFIIMQFIRGTTLERRLQEGPVPPDGAVEYARQILRGLQAAHQKGVVHRDVKPGNVMLADDVCRLVDFGLARDIDSYDEYQGMVVGTPFYIPPEQWLGKEVDARSDLYSLGAILYEMLTGRRPFEAKTMNELMKLHLRALPPSPRQVNPSVGDGLSAIVAKLMAKEPGRRYASAEGLLQDLDRLDRREDVRAMIESKRVIRCQVCDTLSPSTAANCKVCGETLRKVPLEVALRSGEFGCPSCERLVEAGRRQCPHCMADYCRMCRRRLAVLKGLCELCG